MVTPSNQGKIRGKVESEAIKYTLDELKRFADFFELGNKNLGKVDKDSIKNIPERYIEECEGIAEGSGIDKNTLLARARKRTSCFQHCSSPPKIYGCHVHPNNDPTNPRRVRSCG